MSKEPSLKTASDELNLTRSYIAPPVASVLKIKAPASVAPFAKAPIEASDESVLLPKCNVPNAPDVELSDDVNPKLPPPFAIVSVI